jgi:hypothetical protein
VLGLEFSHSSAHPSCAMWFLYAENFSFYFELDLIACVICTTGVCCVVLCCVVLWCVCVVLCIVVLWCVLCCGVCVLWCVVCVCWGVFVLWCVCVCCVVVCVVVCACVCVVVCVCVLWCVCVYLGGGTARIGLDFYINFAYCSCFGMIYWLHGPYICTETLKEVNQRSDWR